MRIGLDATRIHLPTGEGTYVRQIVLHLARQFPNDSFIVLVPEHRDELTLSNITQVHFGAIDGLRGRLKYFLTVGKLLERLKVDVFHNLSNYGFCNSPCPTVTTVHDLMSRKFPELRPSRIQGLIYRYALPNVLGLSQCIAASSQSTVNDLIEFYKLKTPIQLTYLGFDKNRFTSTIDCDEEILARYTLSPGYVLFVGYLTPKKNVEVVVRAMAVLKAKGLTLRLVLAGKKGYGTEGLKQLIEMLGLERQVREIGYVPEEHLPALYRQSRIFVFPSIYEGFGLPVLEAMACGTAALASNVSSLPEVVGNPECLCPPHDEIAWASAIQKLFTDDAYRDAVISQGKCQAEKFSWVACASELHKIYADLGQNTRCQISS